MAVDAESCCSIGLSRWLSHVLFGTPLRDRPPQPPPPLDPCPHVLDSHAGPGVMVRGASCKFKDHYAVTEVVGTGAFGKVSIAQNKQYGMERALKVSRDFGKTSSFEQEVAIHRKLDHPHIVRLYEEYEAAKGGHHILMELCKGGNVEELLQSTGRPFKESEARHLFVQMMRALQYLHRKAIAHRDIKLENLLIKDEKDRVDQAILKVTDFGLAVDFSPGEASMQTLCGSPVYMAPEVICCGTDKEARYNEKCDVFASGVALWRMVFLRFPFEGSSVKDIFAKVSEKGRSPDCSEQEWERCSKDLRTLLVAALLVKTPGRRASTDEVFSHPWMANHMGMSRSLRRSQTPRLTTELLTNVVRYSKKSPFHKVALKYAAFNLNDEKVEDLREVFLDLDKDGDGRITTKEIQDCMTQMESEKEFPQTPHSKEDICSYFSKADLDGNGSLEYTEFLAATMRPMNTLSEQAGEEACMAAFRTLDLDGTGRITATEVEKLTGQTAGQWCSDFDADGDGTLNAHEFATMLRRRTASIGSLTSNPALGGNAVSPQSSGASGSPDARLPRAATSPRTNSGVSTSIPEDGFVDAFSTTPAATSPARSVKERGALGPLG